MENIPCGCNEPKPCGCTNPCGCNPPEICGCDKKIDLECTYYKGEQLLPLNINKGTDGQTIVKIINDYLSELADPEIEPILIKSTGDRTPIYSGLSNSYIHEIKSIEGTEGIQLTEETDLGEGKYINTKIDKEWLKDYIIHLLINEIDICEIISGCATIPPVNDAPLTEDVVLNIPHNSVETINMSDLIYSDPNGDYITDIEITGNVDDYELDSVQYISGQEIPVFDIQNDKLKFVAQPILTAYQSIVQYRVKDSHGAWSNISNLTINIAEKIIPVFNSTTVALIRGTSNTKSVPVTYSNGSGQVLTAGQILYTTGTVGQPGYIRVYVETTTTLLNGGGQLPLTIVSYPYPTTTGNPASVSYTIDDGTGIINLTYSSIPTNETFTISTNYMEPIVFNTSMFVSHMADLDNDIVDVRINPQVDSLTGYLYNGAPYTGEWINVADLGNLTFQPSNITAGYTKTNKWETRDSLGNISL